MTDRKIVDLWHKRHRRHTELGRLLDHSDQHQAWTDAVRSLLPEALAAEVSVVNFRIPTLVLQASTASFATRLRYLLPELTNKLRILADFHALESIRITVNQAVALESEPASKRTLTPVAAKALEDCAIALSNQEDYAELAAAFLRLSKHSAALSTKREPDQS